MARGQTQAKMNTQVTHPNPFSRAGMVWKNWAALARLAMETPI